MISRHFIPTALAGVITLAAGAVDIRAQNPQAPAQPPADQQEVVVTAELLERFVDVYPQVLEASQQAQAELATVTDSAQAQAIQARAEETIMGVLQEEEMSTAEYQAVVTTLRDDPERREQFMTMLQEAQNEPDA